MKGVDRNLTAMPKWIAKYHAYLIARTTSMGPQDRWIEMKTYMFPWFIPLFFAIPICFFFFKDDAQGRLMVVLPLGAISIFGSIYVGSVFLIYGVRADMRRLNERKAGDA
jgi:hypothetical protein